LFETPPQRWEDVENNIQHFVRGPANREAPEPQVLRDAHLGEHVTTFRNEHKSASDAMRGILMVNTLTKEGDTSLPSAKDAGERVAQCGLSGAVWPQYSDCLTEAYLKRYTVEDLRRAVAAYQAVHDKSCP
jgi:hypothetical protein